MNQLPVTLPKQPERKPAEDYYRLRREGIGFIEQMGNRVWTDYNTHDPGTTILEALCYAITDLAYRISWDIKDILAPATPSTKPNQPFPNQPFFTAREILTVSPWTPDDFRRLLIDLGHVRNAWVVCKQCACDLNYYAWCEEDQLMLSFQKPTDPDLHPNKVEPLGLYEVLLELESDPELGDLNDRKIEYRYNVFDSDDKPHPVTLELRFPEWELGKPGEWRSFLDSEASFSVNKLRFGATKTYDVLTELDEKRCDEYLQRYWRRVFYVDFEIALSGGENIIIENAALRIFSDSFVRNGAEFENIKNILEDETAIGFIQRYQNKLRRVEDAIAASKAHLHKHRNLDEDYCRVKGVDVEDIAVCADVEVAPDADIERVQARIWFEIERYFNPPVPFYNLKELMDADVPVEDIFNGPKLENGFIKAKELESAQLKTVLRTSDMIDRLMEIDGVVAINNLLLSKYNTEGNIVTGAADPDWNEDFSVPTFDASKVSAAWLLFISELHQPRLYYNQSRFLFYKNGLPFLPRKDEAYDTLMQLRGEAERPKIKNAVDDLSTPTGTFRDLEDYPPLQYSFPLNYGIGPDGLPSHVSALRRAQAKQLKAYLMVFEQLLGSAFTQVAHIADLFSLDPNIGRTYFVREFSETLIRGYTDLINGLNPSALEAMTETSPEFLERRNRFLDHIMARFGEQFSEYTLLLTSLQGRQVALDRLIDDKISFLNAYPEIGHDRCKAFDYTENPCSAANIAGIKKRVSLLLGYPNLTFHWSKPSHVAADQYQVTYQLKDRNEKVWLSGDLTVSSTSPDKVADQAFRDIIVRMIQSDAYEISENGTFQLKLEDKNGKLLGQHPLLFETKTQAQTLKEELLSWSANERAIVVEHLLLRPKFPGDALYPACSEGDCETCGDEDPYSFRLTFVMPGWTAPFNTNLNMREFADRTIRQEIPSHLLGKICWVGNDGFIEDFCEPVIVELVELLITKGLFPGDTDKYDLRLMSVGSINDLVNIGHSLVIVALVGTDIHIRIFNADGKKLIDKSEDELVSGQKLKDLKQLLNSDPFPIVSDLSQEEKQKTIDEAISIAACDCAAIIYTVFSQVFKDWYEDKTLHYIQSDALEKAVKDEFEKVNPAGISCPIDLNDAALWAEIETMMINHFHHIALYGWQFERFEDAWCQWLEANAGIDWTQERLQDRVQAILMSHVVTGASAAQSQQDALCRCAATILTKYGMGFYGWMETNFKAGKRFENFTDFNPEPVALCDGFTFKPGTAAKIETLLKKSYDEYQKVSYRLRVVVSLLSKLTNTYPPATLHDCDDGSDENPVRLGRTALGR